jgi:ATP-dependent DNA helicase RecG
MALPVNISELINGITVAWERIEFKEGWKAVEVLHTICAFANDMNNWGGGYIVIGIKERDGRAILPPVGLATEKIDSIQKELLNLSNRLKPNYFPIAEPVKFQDKKILVIWVPGGQNRPYQAPITLTKKPQYAYYIRRFSATVKAKFEDEKELISLAGTIPFDDRITHAAEIEDLKLPLVKSFLKEVNSELYKTVSNMPFEQLCRQMAIVDGPDEYLKPRNVGILFFNDYPQKFIPLAQIEVVEFPTTPGGDRLNEKIFQGPIDQQVRDVLTYLNNVFLKEYIQKLPDRAEAVRFFNYPYVALEECIVNAFYHRGYDIREPIEVRIHPDRIEILNFPGPDRSIKMEDIKRGVMVGRRYRNRRIGEFFKELKFTEGRCTGVPKILEAMKNNGSPPPIFETDEERTYFISILRIHPGIH